MSSDHGHAAAHAHDDDHHPFDPEPVQDLASDETPSPTWLPVAGGAAFLIAAVWFFYPGGDPRPADPSPSAAVAAPAAVAPAAPTMVVPARLRPEGSAPRKRPALDLKAAAPRKAAPRPAPAGSPAGAP